MPQLDISVFPTQIFWLVITFLPLFLIVWRIIVPRISDTLEARQKRINDNLEKATRSKEEAEVANKAYEAYIAEAQIDASRIISDSKVLLANEIEKQEAETSSRLDSIIEKSDTRIQKTIKESLKGIDAVAIEVTKATAELLLSEKIDKKVLNKAVENAIKQRV